MLKRKIETILADWKNTPNKSPLIIKGQRQCGKTFSVRNFAEKNYKHVVYLNFLKNPDYISIFNGSLEVDNLIIMMSALLGNKKNTNFRNVIHAWKGAGKYLLDIVAERKNGSDCP